MVERQQHAWTRRDGGDQHCGQKDRKEGQAEHRTHARTRIIRPRKASTPPNREQDAPATLVGSAPAPLPPPFEQECGPISSGLCSHFNQPQQKPLRQKLLLLAERCSFSAKGASSPKKELLFSESRFFRPKRTFFLRKGAPFFEKLLLFQKSFFFWAGAAASRDYSDLSPSGACQRQISRTPGKSLNRPWRIWDVFAKDRCPYPSKQPLGIIRDVFVTAAINGPAPLRTAEQNTPDFSRAQRHTPSKENS